MAKRISISVPDEMFAKLTELKDELVDGGDKDGKYSRKISRVCQKALSDALVAAEVSRVYRMAGVKDGKIAAGSMSEMDKKFMAKVLGGDGLYKKWPRNEKVEMLNNHFHHDKRYDFLIPKFMDLMDGKIILADWVESDPDKWEDRVGEMSWSYIEGFYEGIVNAFTKENRGER